MFNLDSFFFSSLPLSLSPSRLLHYYTHLCPPSVFSFSSFSRLTFSPSSCLSCRSQLLLGSLKKEPREVKKEEEQSASVPRQKKRHTFSRRAQIYSHRAGVNIYLRFLEEEEKGIIFMSFTESLEWLPRCGICPVECEGCMLDLLLPPKCLGRKRCIILVTHAVSSQFVFGHKWKIQLALVCHWRRPVLARTHARTHTHLRSQTRAHTHTHTHRHVWFLSRALL